MKRNSAYPIPDTFRSSGLTKRELIAAMVLQGVVSGKTGYPYDKDALDVIRRVLLYTDTLLKVLGETRND